MHEMNNLHTVLFGHASLLKNVGERPCGVGALDELLWTCKACHRMLWGIARGAGMEKAGECISWK